MKNRRQFLKSAGVAATALPLFPVILQAGEILPEQWSKSFVIRDLRFPVSELFAEELERKGYSILDVNADVSSAYLELARLIDLDAVADISGITTFTARDILGTLFVKPAFDLKLDKRVFAEGNVQAVELVLWTYS